MIRFHLIYIEVIIMNKRVLFFFFINLLALSLFVCSSDHGIAPLPGKLGVNVIFLMNDVPENTEGVYLFVAPEFPPHAINEMYLSPNSLPTNELDLREDKIRDTLYTEIDLPYGHYEAIGLWWYNKETTSNLADVFTLLIEAKPPTYELQLVTIDITQENPFPKIELPANMGRVERDAYIKGTIYFNGPFPKNTLVTAVAAYNKMPVEKVEYLIYLKSMDFTINENPYHYKLPVPNFPRTIGFLGVFWLPERSGLGDFQTVGFWEDPNNPGQPGTLRIAPNDTIYGYDINVDWTLINP